MNVRFRLSQVWDRIRTGDVRGLAGRALHRLHSETLRVGIRKDLTSAAESPSTPAENPIRIATMADISAVLDPRRGGAGNVEEISQRRLRLRLAATVGADRCYVADCGDLGPSFMQFLFFAADNAILQAEFPGLAPPVGPDEAMVEYLYVAPDARSLPYVSACIAQVTAEARRRGAASILTYTTVSNKPALLMMQLAGFKPFTMRRSRYRFFRRSVSYEPYSESITSG